MGVESGGRSERSGQKSSEDTLRVRRGDRLRLSIKAGGIVAGGILVNMLKVRYVSGT